MADERNRFLPQVFRTGNPDIDRNLDSIYQTFRRLIVGNGGELDDHEVKADSTDTGHGPLKDKLKDTATLTWQVDTTGGVHTVKGNVQGIPAPTPLSDDDPLPDAPDADPGVGTSASRWDHVHPLARPSKIRYYLSDTHGTGEWTGHLLLTTNPYDEGSAIDLSNAANLSQFVSPPGSPGLAIWNGGTSLAHLRIKLTGARSGRTYTLYMGNGDKVYTHLIGDYTSGDVYQTTPFPTEPAITETYATLDIDVPVATLAAGNTHRFELKLCLRAFVSGVEDGLDGEQLVVRVGGDNASYIDTPFTPDGSFAGLHNDLDGREAANAHPMSAITPGRILTPSSATVTPIDGLFSVPSNSNYVEVDGTDDVIGVSTAGWTGTNSKIDVLFTQQRVLKRLQDVPDGHAPLTWGTGDAGYGEDIGTLTVYADSVVSFRLIGGRWRIVGMLNL